MPQHPGSSHNPVSQSKAKEILKDGSIRGKSITTKQRGLFGAVARGQKVRLSDRAKR